MKLILKAKRIFTRQSILVCLILFLITFIYFTIIQAQPNFADPDSFYHAKMALLIKDQGIVSNFEYLQFTTLSENFADHHFLYHVFLIPFVSFVDPLIGLKIATIFFATLTIIAFYLLLKKLNVKYAFLYTLILLATNPFIFRLNLAKAQSLAIAALLLGLYLIIQRRYLLLAILSFLFVWLYGGWPLIMVVTIFYIVGSYLPNLHIKKKWLAFYDKFQRKKITKENIKLLMSVTSGLLAGLVINPYFPKNIYFYWQQIVQIAVVNYQDIIGVGGEWYPYNFLELTAGSVLVFILLILGLTFFAVNYKKQKTTTWTFLLLTIFFLVFTLRSRRNVEYFEPMAVIFSALSINGYIFTKEFKKVVKEIKEYKLVKILIITVLLISAVLLPYIIYRDVKRVYNDHGAGYHFDTFKGASKWLKTNSQKGQIVFHSDWDEFPPLFYHNSNNNYIVGLDPTFMYNYNIDLYWDWYIITTAQEVDNLHNLVKNTFNADYFFIELDSHGLLDRNLMNNFYFKLVYQDKETKIYKVK